MSNDTENKSSSVPEYRPSLIEILEENAATKIQAYTRMKLAQTKSRKLRIVLRKIVLIQGWFRIWLGKKTTKTNVIKKNRSTYDRFIELQNWFKHEWSYIKQAGRVELHYNSIGKSELEKLSMDKFESRQNLQIGRIFNIVNSIFDL